MQLYVTHAITCYLNKVVVFSETVSFCHLVVPLNNFASMSSWPWVQGKSSKPTPPEVCVCVGGGDSYSMVLPQYLDSLIFIDMQMR